MSEQAPKVQPPQPPLNPVVPATTPAPAPHHRDGKLTRAGMEHVIKSGGGVIHNGNVVNTVAGLPNEAEMAKGDEAAEATAQENINRQRAALDAQEATLKANKKK